MSKIPLKLVAEIRLEAENRCGYCLAEQKYVMAWLEIEHIFPLAKGGASEKENLWLACPFYNTFKSSQTHAIDPVTKRKVPLFNPRKQYWKRHFEIINRIEIVGKTAVGRATVVALQINNEIAVTVRRNWYIAGWYPPKD